MRKIPAKAKLRPPCFFLLSSNSLIFFFNYFNLLVLFIFFFFFNDTATTEIYTLSLHDALPIYPRGDGRRSTAPARSCCPPSRDRKSTRLNSSHEWISYAVFCLKKKKKN